MPPLFFTRVSLGVGGSRAPFPLETGHCWARNIWNTWGRSPSRRLQRPGQPLGWLWFTQHFLNTFWMLG